MARNDQKKAQALAALLESDTLSQAAERAGISRKTMFNYIHDDPNFAQEYMNLRNLKAMTTLERLEAQEETAAEVITSILQDEEQPAAVRLRAAHEVLAAAANQREIVAGFALKNLQANNPIDIFGNIM